MCRPIRKRFSVETQLYYQIEFYILPRLRCQTDSRYVQAEKNAPGGVVRSKLHGLEKNERTIVST